VPHRALITLQTHSVPVQGLLDRYPELPRALEAAGASLVVFWVEGRAGDFARAAQRALEQAEASLPVDSGTPIFVCECTFGSLRALLVSPPPQGRPSDLRLRLHLRPRRGVFGGVVGMGEGGVMVFDDAGRRLAGWDEPRTALLERIRTVGGAARAPR
jgi:hypothetical protein